MSEIIEISSAPLLPQQAGDQLIAVRNGAIVRAIAPEQFVLAPVAKTGNYSDLLGLPDLSLTGLGAAAAAQGLLAETAVQPAALFNFESTAQLDVRDIANRNRENHTGTQPASTIADFAAAAAAAAPVQSVAGKSGAVVLTKADVGLSQADNTSDLEKPISAAAQAALSLKLEPQAIAAFETTTQLNTRDTVNRNRANHTGLQPAATITGLATVATTGTYADLSGLPAIPAGFTYDQQGEPLSPATGATWRERSAGGMTLGQWQWSGSLWLGPRQKIPAMLPAGNYAAVTVAAAPIFLFQNFPHSPHKHLVESVILHGRTTGIPINATNYYAVAVEQRGDATTRIVFPTPVTTQLSSEGAVNMVIPINQFLNDSNAIGIVTVLTVGAGAPGSARLYTTAIVREAR